VKYRFQLLSACGVGKDQPAKFATVELPAGIKASRAEGRDNLAQGGFAGCHQCAGNLVGINNRCTQSPE
jgi:hypothetical protein